MTEPTHGDIGRQAQEMLEWIKDWREGQFEPAPTRDGWTVEMHGLADSAEQNIRGLLAAVDALEAERDQLRQAFETEVRVCSARTTMLQAAENRADDLRYEAVGLHDALRKETARADALEAERDELKGRADDYWKAWNEEHSIVIAQYQRADAEANRADDLANQLQEAEDLLDRARTLLFEGPLESEINEFLTRRQ